jgi:hypothetical protein
LPDEEEAAAVEVAGAAAAVAVAPHESTEAVEEAFAFFGSGDAMAREKRKVAVRTENFMLTDFGLDWWFSWVIVLKEVEYKQ